MKLMKLSLSALCAMVAAGVSVPSEATVIIASFSGKLTSAQNNTYDDPSIPSSDFFKIGQAFSGSFSYDTDKPIENDGDFALLDLQTFNVIIGGVDFSDRFLPRLTGRSADGGVEFLAGGASQGGSTSISLNLSSFFGNYPTANELNGRTASFFYGDYTPLGGVVSGDALLSVEGATSPVPEPATWLFMVAGFGVVGYGMRRRRVLFTPAHS
jgi:hypothetical protein